MVDKIETTEVVRQYCDFCEEPQTYPVRACAICKKKMCSRGESNGCGHAAFSVLKIRKPRARVGDEDEERSRLYICKECTKETLNMPVGELFDGMMQDQFSFEKFKVRKGC